MAKSVTDGIPYLYRITGTQKKNVARVSFMYYLSLLGKYITVPSDFNIQSGFVCRSFRLTTRLGIQIS